MTPGKYNNVQVALHWLTAALIMFLLITGSVVLGHMDNADPEKIGNLRIHMSLGGLAFVLVLARIAWRKKTPQPEHLKTGNAVLDKLGVAAHYALNLLALLIAVSGVALALMSGLTDLVFFGEGTMPKDFFDYPPRQVHNIATKIMLALVALHILGGLYHALIIKDGPFKRIWFGGS